MGGGMFRQDFWMGRGMEMGERRGREGDEVIMLS